MKSLLNTLLILVVTLFITVLPAIAQQSDYQIKEEFEVKYSELLVDIESAQKVSKIDTLLLSIENFKAAYSKHITMLDYALYPESFGSKIAQLKSNARSAEHKLLIIENQSERLSMLTDEVLRFKSELSLLNNKSDSLRDAITLSQKSESRLSDLVTSYRKSVEKRDHFIFNMIDSLFITYAQLDSNSLQEFSGNNSSININSIDNPLAIISSILTENIEILKASSESLRVEDYLRIYALQAKVNDVWDNIGDNLVELYGGNDKARWKKRIDTNLKDWKASASLSMWSSLDSYLELQNIDLGAFDNNSSFFSALDNFVSKEMKKSEDEILNHSSFDDFKTLSEFWSSKVMNEWNNYIVEADILSSSQISIIDDKIDNWGRSSEPFSTSTKIIFGLIIVAFAGMIIALVVK